MAEAYLRGVERRIAAGLKPNVGSAPHCLSVVEMSRIEILAVIASKSATLTQVQ